MRVERRGAGQYVGSGSFGGDDVPPIDPAQLQDLGLALSQAQLARIAEVLLRRLQKGLAAVDGEIAMLPAFLTPPADDLAGEAVAVDAGGTNLRAARVRLEPGGRAELASSVVEAPLPGAAGRPPAAARDFFMAHQELLQQLDADRLPIGYCFSYPITSQPDGDAVLNKWTKEVRVAGVEGQAVGAALRAHLQAHDWHPGPVVVLNDTIAALVAGSFAAGVVPRRCVGLIVGTGSNIGAFLPAAAITKLDDSSSPSPMAVNFESGGFAPPALGPVDDDVDRASAKPGQQRFEKAISGAYLGHLFTAASRRIGLPRSSDPVAADDVSRLAAAGEDAADNVLARALLARSADLVAAALAATDALIGGAGDLYVCAEGSLFWKAPEYVDRVGATLDHLLEGKERPGRARVFATAHANLVGSAAAVLGSERLG